MDTNKGVLYTLTSKKSLLCRDTVSAILLIGIGIVRSVLVWRTEGTQTSDRSLFIRRA